MPGQWIVITDPDGEEHRFPADQYTQGQAIQEVRRLRGENVAPDTPLANMGPLINSGIGGLIDSLGGAADYVGLDAVGAPLQDVGQSMQRRASTRFSPWLQRDRDLQGDQNGDGIPDFQFGDFYGAVVESAPSTAAIMAPGIALGGLGRLAGSRTLMNAARPASVVLEGSQTTGGLTSSIENSIRSFALDDPEGFAASAEGARALQETNGDYGQAVELVAERANGATPLIAGAIVSAIGARGVDPAALFRSEAGQEAVRRFMPTILRRGIQEAGEEFLQSGVEQVSGNLAVGAVDPNRDILDNVLDSMILGAGAGGIGGLTFGAAETGGNMLRDSYFRDQANDETDEELDANRDRVMQGYDEAESFDGFGDLPGTEIDEPAPREATRPEPAPAPSRESTNPGWQYSVDEALFDYINTFEGRSQGESPTDAEVATRTNALVDALLEAGASQEDIYEASQSPETMVALAERFAGELPADTEAEQVPDQAADDGGQEDEFEGADDEQPISPSRNYYTNLDRLEQAFYDREESIERDDNDAYEDAHGIMVGAARELFGDEYADAYQAAYENDIADTGGENAPRLEAKVATDIENYLVEQGRLKGIHGEADPGGEVRGEAEDTEAVDLPTELAAPNIPLEEVESGAGERALREAGDRGVAEAEVSDPPARATLDDIKALVGIEKPEDFDAEVVARGWTVADLKAIRDTLPAPTDSNDQSSQANLYRAVGDAMQAARKAQQTKGSSDATKSLKPPVRGENQQRQPTTTPLERPVSKAAAPKIKVVDSETASKLRALSSRSPQALQVNPNSMASLERAVSDAREQVGEKRIGPQTRTPAEHDTKAEWLIAEAKRLLARAPKEETPAQFDEDKISNALADKDLAKSSKTRGEASASEPRATKSKDRLERVSAAIHDEWESHARSVIENATPARAASWKANFGGYDGLTDAIQEYDRIEARPMIEAAGKAATEKAAVADIAEMERERHQRWINTVISKNQVGEGAKEWLQSPRAKKIFEERYRDFAKEIVAITGFGWDKATETREEGTSRPLSTPAAPVDEGTGEVTPEPEATDTDADTPAADEVQEKTAAQTMQSQLERDLGGIDPTVPRPSEDYDTPTSSDYSLISDMEEVAQTKAGKLLKDPMLRATRRAEKAFELAVADPGPDGEVDLNDFNVEVFIDALNGIDGVFERARAATVAGRYVDAETRAEMRERVYGFNAVMEYLEESGDALWGGLYMSGKRPVIIDFKGPNLKKDTIEAIRKLNKKIGQWNGLMFDEDGSNLNQVLDNVRKNERELRNLLQRAYREDRAFFQDELRLDQDGLKDAVALLLTGERTEDAFDGEYEDAVNLLDNIVVSFDEAMGDAQSYATKKKQERLSKEIRNLRANQDNSVLRGNWASPAHSGIKSLGERQKAYDFVRNALIPALNRLRVKEHPKNARDQRRAERAYYDLLSAITAHINNDLTHEMRAELLHRSNGWLANQVGEGKVVARTADDIYHMATSGLFVGGDWRQFTGRDSGPQPKYSYAWQERKQALATRLNQYLSQMGFKDVTGRIVDVVRNDENMEPVEQASASYLSKLMLISMGGDEYTEGRSLNDLSLDEAWEVVKQRANHELVHAIRHFGLLKDTEWDVLKAMSRSHGINEDGKIVPAGKGESFHDHIARDALYQDVLKRYPPTERAIIADEEAVAIMLQNMKHLPPGRPKTILRKIEQFIRAIMRALRGAKFRNAADLCINAQDIIGHMYDGTVGARTRDYSRAVGKSANAISEAARAADGQSYMFGRFFGRKRGPKIDDPEGYKEVSGPEEEPVDSGRANMALMRQLNSLNRGELDFLRWAEIAIDIENEIDDLMAEADGLILDETKGFHFQQLNLDLRDAVDRKNQIVNALGDDFWDNHFLIGLWSAIVTTRKHVADLTPEEIDEYQRFAEKSSDEKYKRPDGGSQNYASSSKPNFVSARSTPSVVKRRSRQVMNEVAKLAKENGGRRPPGWRALVAENLGISEAQVERSWSLILNGTYGERMQRGAAEMPSAPRAPRSKEYSLAAMDRFLTAIEKTAEDNGGERPTDWQERVSKATKYTPAVVKKLWGEVYRGEHGAELQSRAIDVRVARPGRPLSPVTQAIERMIDEGMKPSEMRDRLVMMIGPNEDFSPETIRGYVTRIKKRRNNEGGGSQSYAGASKPKTVGEIVWEQKANHRPNINGNVVRGLLAEGVTDAEEIQARVNEHRAELGLPPSNLKAVKQTIGRLRREMFKEEAHKKGDIAGTYQEPSEYMRAAMTRFVDAVQFQADKNGGRPPPGWAEAVALETGYSDGSIKTIWERIQNGEYGEPLAKRARAIPNSGRAPSPQKQLIAKLMDQGLDRHTILKRVNSIRSSAKAPMSLQNVSAVMSQIKAERKAGKQSYGSRSKPKAANALWSPKLFGQVPSPYQQRPGRQYDINPLQMYSRAEKHATEFPTDRSTKGYMRKWLAKRVKKEELDWIGIDELLGGNATDKVTKQELVDWIRANKIHMSVNYYYGRGTDEQAAKFAQFTNEPAQLFDSYRYPDNTNPSMRIAQHGQYTILGSPRVFDHRFIEVSAKVLPGQPGAEGDYAHFGGPGTMWGFLASDLPVTLRGVLYNAFMIHQGQSDYHDAEDEQYVDIEQRPILIAGLQEENKALLKELTELTKDYPKINHDGNRPKSGSNYSYSNDRDHAVSLPLTAGGVEGFGSRYSDYDPTLATSYHDLASNIDGRIFKIAENAWESVLNRRFKAIHGKVRNEIKWPEERELLEAYEDMEIGAWAAEDVQGYYHDEGVEGWNANEYEALLQRQMKMAKDGLEKVKAYDDERITEEERNEGIADSLDFIERLEETHAIIRREVKALEAGELPFEMDVLPPWPVMKKIFAVAKNIKVNARKIEDLGRTNGLRHSKAPFRYSWPEAMFRHALMMAISSGHDALAWASGDTIRKYIGHSSYAGDFYDERWPNYAKNWLRRFSPVVHTMNYNMSMLTEDDFREANRDINIIDEVDQRMSGEARDLAGDVATAYLRQPLVVGYDLLSTLLYDMTGDFPDHHEHMTQAFANENLAVLDRRLQDLIDEAHKAIIAVREERLEEEEPGYEKLADVYSDDDLRRMAEQFARRYFERFETVLQTVQNEAVDRAQGKAKKGGSKIYVMPITQEMRDHFRNVGGAQMMASRSRPHTITPGAQRSFKRGDAVSRMMGLQPPTARGFSNARKPGESFLGQQPRERVQRILDITRRQGASPTHWSKRTSAKITTYLANVGRGLEKRNPNLTVGHTLGRGIRNFAYGITTLGNLPGQGYYLTLRSMLMGDINSGIDHAERLNKLSDRMTAADYDQFGEYMLTRDADPSLIQDPDVRAAAVLSKDLFNAFGEENVRIGRLDERQFEKYRDRYLPRKYFRYIENSLRTTGIRLGKEGYTRERLPGQDRQIFGAVDLGGETSSVEALRKRLTELFENVSEADKTRAGMYLAYRVRTPNAVSDAGLRNALASIRHELAQIEAHIDTLDLITMAPAFPRGYKSAAPGTIPFGPYQMKRRYGDHYLKRAVFRAAKKDHSIGYVLEQSAVDAQITDPIVLSATGLAEQNRDLAVYHFFTALQAFQDEATKADPDLNIQWLYPDQIVEWRGKQMTVDALQATLESAQKNFHLNQHPVMRSYAEKEIQMMQEIIEANRIDDKSIGDEYIRLPNTPAYGPMRGLIVHRAIHNDLKGTLGIDTINETGSQKALKNFMSFFKQAMTTLNIPKGHTRALFQNVATMYFSGVGGHDVGLMVPSINIQTWRWFIKALGYMESNHELWSEFQELGGRAGTFTTTELRHAYGLVRKLKIQERLSAGDKTAQIQAVLDLIDGAKGIAADMFNFWDTWARFTKYAHEIEHNKALPGDAMIEANEWAPDYSLVPQWVREARNYYIPFLTFFYKLTPKFADQISRVAGHVKRGEVFKAGDVALRFASPMMLWTGVTSMASAALLGMDEDEHKSLRASMTKYFRENPGVIPLPFRDENGRIMLVDIGIMFPWTQSVRAGAYLSQANILAAAGQIGFGHPVVAVGAAWQTGVDPYTGMPLFPETATEAEKNIAYVAFIFNYLTPPPMRGLIDPLVGALTGRKVQLGGGEIARTMDYFVGDGMTQSGKPIEDPPYLAARFLTGFNFNAFEPLDQVGRNIRQLEHDLNEVERDRSAAVRDYGNRSRRLRREGRSERVDNLRREHRLYLERLDERRDRLRKKISDYRREVRPIVRFERAVRDAEDEE